MIKKTFNRLYYAVSYWRIDDSLDSDKEKDSAILFNIYIFLLSVFFLIQSAFNIFFIGIYSNALLLFCISLFYCFCFLFLRDILMNRYCIILSFIALTFLVTFYSCYYGIKSGTFLYYFPLLLAVYLFFSSENDRLLIIFLTALILSNIYISAFSNFEIFDHNEKYESFDNYLLIVNISSVLVLMFVNSYYFIQKREKYYITLYRNLYRKQQIENLSNELKRLKENLNKEAFSEETLKELIESVQLSDMIFIEKFNTAFPDFFEKLNAISSNSLNISDRKMCAMLKLGFTSKQIAIYTNSSIKSVEGKIYRLRKKLNLSSDVDSRVWFSAI